MKKNLTATIFVVLCSFGMAGDGKEPMPTLYKDAEVLKIASKFGLKKIFTKGTLLDLSKKNAIQAKNDKALPWAKLIQNYELNLSKLIDIEGFSSQSVSFSRYKVSSSYELIIYAKNVEPQGDGFVKAVTVFFAPHHNSQYGSNFSDGPISWGKIKMNNSTKAPRKPRAKK